MLTLFCSILGGVSFFLAVSYIQEKERIGTLRKSKAVTDSIIKRILNSDYAARLVMFCAKLNGRLPFGSYRVRLQALLLLSGTEVRCTADEFLAKKEIFFLLGLFLPVLAGAAVWLASAVALTVSFLPDLEVRKTRKDYEKDVLRSLPVALDILAACIEAGLTFDASLAKYVEKCAGNALSAELRTYLEEVRLGKSRQAALVAFAARSGVEEIRSFTLAAARSIEHGTGMAAALRSLCESNRLASTLRAEKKAAEAPVKLLFPLIFFIFPVIFLIIFGPLLLRFLSQK